MAGGYCRGRLLPKDALTMIQMEPDHFDPVWEATKNNVLN